MERPNISSMRLLALFFLFSLTTSATAKDPLFEDDALLRITLEGPLKSLNEARIKDRRFPATVMFEDEKGVMTELPLEVSARGNKRRSKSVCAFPPLKLSFKKEDTDGTLFHKENRLKLVTQCHPAYRKYQSYVITEYLIYRSLNILTDRSYQVRLAEISYQDGDDVLFTNFGIVLERTKRLAKRLELKQLKTKETDATQLEGRHLNLISLFQMMIANTDWSATHGGNDECCHNGKLFHEPDHPDKPYLFIPYDFDMTGLVNPEYAAVDKALKLDSIRERRYRGYCRNTDYLEENIALFNEKREQILDLFRESPYLTGREKKRRVGYITKFYDLINNPKRVERKILGWCHESTLIETASTDR